MPVQREHPRRNPLAVLVVTALFTSSCANIVQLEAGDPVEFVQQPQTSQVLAADGSVLVELHAEQDREDIPLTEMGDAIVDAVVSMEDRRYFVHRGVDLAAIVRAAVRNIEIGDIEQGGSTITQQYVKNTMTGPARTLERKLEEAALAYQLEQRYSKEEILERYLNTIYFGHGAYGVHAAAERFFGLEPDDLELHQAALLAGLIASPTRFDPYEHPEAAQHRVRQVLGAMVATSQISGTQAELVADDDLDLAPLETDERTPAPHFVEEVKRLIQHDPDGRFAILGDDIDARVDALFTGGLRIHTTVDLEQQVQAEEAVAEVLTAPDDPSAAIVAVEPASGAVRALVGGRDFYDRDQPDARFNLATQARRQPGSSFKPIVLATALQRGVSLEREFPGGTCVSFPELGWEPCNYGGTAYPTMSLREATVRSVNTVYARLAVELGPVAIVEMAKTMGFDSELPQVPSIALGSAEVTPLEMAGAYGAFAALGTYHEPYLIERIETPDGEVLYEHDPRGLQVLDEAAAYLVNQALTDVVRRGTGVRAQVDRPQAGKTGTSQNNADAWFIGYTPDLVAAVWVGFPEASIPMEPPTTRIRVEGGRWPAEIWKGFAARALDGTPPSAFPVPEVDLVVVDVDVTRNCLPNPYTPQELIEPRQYLRGTEPIERCNEPTGPPLDDVPSVTGLPLAVAQQLLEDKGFVVATRPEASLVFPPGIVTRQRPSPGGSTLPMDGNAVVLWVSQSVRSQAQVPDVLGLDRVDAIATLEAAGWVVEVRPECPLDGCGSNAVPDQVWGQQPAPGTEQREHSAVVIRVYPDETAPG
ncbi:MAG: PBP1A family penicillin-binding protein [Actinobacteria bacterium]|nr:PBP1A family penicillin-binding protein [Actinomycetota bacterium]